MHGSGDDERIEHRLAYLPNVEAEAALRGVGVHRSTCQSRCNCPAAATNAETQMLPLTPLPLSTRAPEALRTPPR